MYLNEGDGFTNHDELIHSSYHVDIADITADAKWILAVDEYGTAYVYTFNFETHEYDVHQSIHLSYYLYAGAITDDHMWIVLGKDNGYVYVYSYDGSQFILNQTIFDESQLVSSVAITNDHEMLAIATYPHVFIYRYDGTRFNK